MPELGRFLQTDSIGYEDNLNLYAYVGNDPVNALDPSGTNVVLITWPGSSGKPHSSLYIFEPIAGGLRNGTLYDPNGSFTETEEWGTSIPRLSGATFDVPLQEYLAWWTRRGADLDGLRFTQLRTTNAENQELIEAAIEMGDAGGMVNCALGCSAVLGILNDVSGSNLYPSGLADRMARHPRMLTGRVYNTETRSMELLPLFRAPFCISCP